MDKLIQKIVAHKKISAAILVLLLIGLILANYLIDAVSENIAVMAEPNDVDYFPPYPQINTAGKDPEVLKRGEYLTKAGDCMACHTSTTTKIKGAPFAGGLPMQTPFGVIYTPNITPDKETGIGNWTDEQFIKAMREGISPTGHYYYPAFPFLYFNKVSTDDLKAIKAYLDSVPAVKQKNLENSLVFPFNWRFLQLGWRILFFHSENTGAYQPDTKKSAEWNRGAYIVQGLGHCSMCHSPSYNMLDENLPLGAPIRKYDLTGAKVQGFLAPNITAASVGKVSIDKIVEVFTKDRLLSGGKVEGPMLEVNRNSLSLLTPEDLKSIAIYLQDVHTESPPKPKAGSGGLGKAIYGAYCSGCHASGAAGAPKYGDASTWTNVLKQSHEAIYQNAIKGINGMPAKGSCLSCSDDEIKQSVDYMLNSIKGSEGKAAVAKAKPLTLEDGKRIYQQNCSGCHTSGINGALKLGDTSAWKPVVDEGFAKAFLDIKNGVKGHPAQGGCTNCSDAELKAALKYLLQESSTGKDFSLW